jgi:hypothetical protein
MASPAGGRIGPGTPHTLMVVAIFSIAAVRPESNDHRRVRAPPQEAVFAGIQPC